MATRTWIGSAPKVAQVTAYVLTGTWEADDKIIFTIGTRSFTLVAGSTNTTTIAALMVTTWNALVAANYPEFSEMTASSNTATFTLTGDTAGVPFTVTISSTEANGGASDSQTIDSVASPTTSTGTNSTACSSPNHWSLAANWAENAVPVNSDDVVIDRGNVDILYGLDQSAVTLTSLTVRRSYTGKIGLPTRNPTGYEEYRDTQLKVSATTANIGIGTVGSGSGRIKLNVGTVQTAINVYGTATTAEAGVPSFCFKGTNASNDVSVYNGDVGIANFSGETAVVLTLRQTGGVVRCSSGVTLTTINKTGGTLFTNSAATTVSNLGGEVTIGSGAHTTVNVTEGTLRYQSTGTITTLNVYKGGVADFSDVNKARTVTNCVITDGAKIDDSASTVTWTNGIDLYQCGLGAVNVNLGEHFTITPSTI